MKPQFPPKKTNLFSPLYSIFPYPFPLTTVSHTIFFPALPEYNTSTEQMKYILFVKPTDPKHELWNGPTIGESAAVAYFKADQVAPIIYCLKVKWVCFNNETLTVIHLFFSNLSSGTHHDGVRMVFRVNGRKLPNTG